VQNEQKTNISRKKMLNSSRNLQEFEEQKVKQVGSVGKVSCCLILIDNKKVEPTNFTAFYGCSKSFSPVLIETNII